MRISLLERKKRKKILGTSYMKLINIGDIIDVFYVRRIVPLSFEGVCIAIKGKKNLLLPGVTFILRNVIMGIGIELSLSLYGHRQFNLVVNDFKRKKYSVKGSRLFYIRHRLNKESKVKR